MASFDDFGLGEALLRALEDEGFERPTALQEATIPALRREGNLVARASSGAGKTLAYGVGILDRLQPRSGTEGEEETGGARMLVLVPTVDEAERVAAALVPYAHAAEVSVTAVGGSWGTRPGEAELLVGSPADVLQAVQGSTLKLETLEAVVVDGAAEIAVLGGWDAVETLFDHLPRDAQRVVVSSSFPQAVEELVDRRVKRALRFPAEAAVPDAQPAPREGTLMYAVLRGDEKLDALARFVANAGDEAAPVLFARTDERAAEIAESLSIRGFLVGEAGEEDTQVAVVASGTTRADLLEDGEEIGRTISVDVPPDVEALRERHGGDARAMVFVEPRELAHLRELAGRANVDLSAVVPPLPESATGEIERFRESLRAAVGREDTAALMLLLEPLFDEFGPAEVAAAAAGLLRARPTSSAAPAEGGPLSGREQAQSGGSRPAGAPTGKAPSAFVRLYVGIGSRDGIRPGDLVGAIAGEANIAGTQVGRIDIRDTFSVVEVQADAAESVIKAVNGTTIRGRSVRVDYDRGTDRARNPGGKPAGGSPARGGAARTGRAPVRRPRPGS